MKEQEMNLTVRQLRKILFHLENQDLTISELRQALFTVKDQDAPLVESFTMWHEIENWLKEQ